MSKFKKIFKQPMVWILLIALIFSIYQISPRLNTNGVLIVSSQFNSSASNAGIESPMSDKYSTLEKIVEVNDIVINDELDYYSIISNLKVNDSLKIKTNNDVYYLSINPKYKTQIVEETYDEVVSQFDSVTNSTINVTNTLKRNVTTKVIDGQEDIGLAIMNVPRTNIRKGLDISGGARLLVRPVSNVDAETLEMIRNNLEQRLNGLGLKDVKVSIVTDLSDDQYIMITIAGKSNTDVLDIIKSQGKFEAKIGDNIVYSGDNNDILDVCRTGDCAYVESCNLMQDGSYGCRFRFSLTISQSGAQKFGDLTEMLNVVTVDEYGNILGAENRYLDEPLKLLLDDKVISSLNIQASLKGNRNANQVSITGFGSGATSQAARTESLKEMQKLQTLLKTGSIPVKLEVVNYEEVSSVLGDEFLSNAIYVGLFAVLAVALVVSIRYREYKIALPIILTMISELIILLGVAVFLGWQIDLVAIAGIIIAIGTGVDDQIVIVDESFSKKDIVQVGWKEKLKRAFFIIFGSYLTTVVAMLPLMKAGAGLLKGFALTTIAGVSIGVFITRQAFASIIEILFE